MSDGDTERRMSDGFSCEDNSGDRQESGSARRGFEDGGVPVRRKPRKASDLSSEEGADDVDEDSTSKSESASGRQGNAAASGTSTSESANAKRETDESESDTEDDVSKDVDERDRPEVAKAMPVPAARKISLPRCDDELTEDELKLSKRETVNLDEEAKEDGVELDSDSSSEEGEKQEATGRNRQPVLQVKVDQVSDGELNKDDELVVEATEAKAEPEVKPKVNVAAEIKRPQFRHSSSSLSDEEDASDDVHAAIHKIPSPTRNVVAEKTQQLLSASPKESATPTSHSPLPTRAGASNLTKIYTEALESNNNVENLKCGRVERTKPGKDVTQIYTQSIAKTGTPPSSPKPVPSRNKDITQLYTGGFQNSNGSNNVKSNSTSPGVIADKLSPKRHNMSTAIDTEAIRQAYEDVRSDTTDTEWAVFKFDGNNLMLAGTGHDFKHFKSSFSNEDRGFGYIRINTGDEMSKRAKFVFITWVGPSVSVMKKAKMSTDKALMKDIIQNMSVEIQLENHTEFSHDHFKSQVDKAAGARYGTGERAM